MSAATQPKKRRAMTRAILVSSVHRFAAAEDETLDADEQARAVIRSASSRYRHIALQSFIVVPAASQQDHYMRPVAGDVGEVATRALPPYNIDETRRDKRGRSVDAFATLAVRKLPS
jgi:hypothetical protein